jgi:predicted transposase YdaD
MPYITSVEEIGMQIGREQGKRDLILRQLTRQLRGAELPAILATQVQALPLPQLEALGEDLLDFKGLPDLQAWLEQQNTGASGAPGQSDGDG